ncbi:carboxymuconolactone decarboxylase family protein [Paraburkholderia sp.]|uniref:carboxymuconolactone decarboxylase family protein n=1 Tax=Paraburkholderia sp. TaxID=1926495 RepID=UPI0039E29B61
MDNELYQEGDSIRRAVLGTEYVTQARMNVDEFSQPYRDFVTQHVWGAVWMRPGLSLKMRSALNVAVLCALGREHELELHIGGALRNGLSKEEIREIFIQVGAYAGVPCAVSAFRVASQAFDKMADADPSV